jgi:hypothetical protein
MTDNVQDIELGTLTASGWDTSGAPVASSPNTYTAAGSPTVSSDSTIGARVGDYWFDSATGNMWIARSVAAGAAVWRFVPRVLAQSSTAVTAPADTAVNVLASYTLLANTMGASGALDIETNWTTNNDASVKTPSIAFGAMVVSLQAMANQVTQYDRCFIVNKTAATQFSRVNNGGGGGWGVSTGAFVTGTVDTTANVTIGIRAEKADGTDTMTLNGYRITLTRPDIGA